MAATDASDVFSTSTSAVAGLFVAGLSLGAVYALGYTRLGRELLGGEDTRTSAGAGAGADTPVHARAHARAARQTGEEEKSTGDLGGGHGLRKRGRRGKSKAKGASGAEGEGEAKDEAKDERERGRGHGHEGTGKGQIKPAGKDSAEMGIVPGSFEDVVAGADVALASTGGMTAEQGTSVGKAPAKKKKTRAKKQKQKQKEKEKETQEQQQGKNEDADSEQDDEAGSETGKEADAAPVGAHRLRLRSGDSTDASVSLSLSPSVSGDALSGLTREMRGGNRVASSQVHPPSRGLRPSLSLDTDSSWTHVNRRRVKTSKSMEGLARGLADPMDVTSSDLASTASDSPVAERMNMREARADLAQRTLAEKLVPRPKTGVDDMLEKPDIPTLARVMRVQPPADETPVPGFSWEDYGDVVEESVLVHDADEEDEGDWGVVKSRHRTRPIQTTTITTTAEAASTSTSHAPASMTKKQRQNARNRELAKAAKAEAETARLQGLAKHKRELEQLRIIEQSRQGGKQQSGGMQATVNDQGKLVWE